MSVVRAKRVTRFAAEMAVALATVALGAAVVIGALQYGVGWSEAGPDPGAFPFYVGLIVVAASAGNALQAWHRRWSGAIFIDHVQARRVLSFCLPLVLFVAGCVAFGFYLATIVYLSAVMRFQGGYRWLTSLAVGFGAAVFFFVVLDVWFKVPLLKGPIEAALGIH